MKNRADLSEKAYDLYNYLLAHHLGKNRGILRPDLAREFGVDERTLRKLTQEINSSMNYDKMVSTSHCCYLCATKEECLNALRNTYNMAITLFKKAKKMEKKVGMNGQVRIALGENYKDFIETFKE